jgi:predicted  nucleic acid-binding Zn-ribbon protein
MIPVINPITGEVEDAPLPVTLDDVNRQIQAFVYGLGKVNQALEEKRRELRKASTEFKVRRHALILSSEYGESTQRAADAESQLYEGEGSLGERKDVLEIEVRILQDKGHDYRAALNALQTAGANIRAEMNLGGAYLGRGG